VWRTERSRSAPRRARSLRNATVPQRPGHRGSNRNRAPSLAARRASVLAEKHGRIRVFAPRAPRLDRRTKLMHFANGLCKTRQSIKRYMASGFFALSGDACASVMHRLRNTASQSREAVHRGRGVANVLTSRYRRIRACRACGDQLDAEVFFRAKLAYRFAILQCLPASPQCRVLHPDDAKAGRGSRMRYCGAHIAWKTIRAGSKPGGQGTDLHGDA
jgi:hypothetical protein